MNNDKHTILRAVYRAIDELNLTLPPEKQVQKNAHAPLGEPPGPLDSLGLVNLVVETEQQIEEMFGVAVNLADQQAATASENPLASVQTLADYIWAKLGEHQSESNGDA
jgi:acyl carrier protein